MTLKPTSVVAAAAAQPATDSCPLCKNALAEAFRATILQTHEARYDVCQSCGFLRVREPIWLSEAYSDAIAVTDTGLLVRNQSIALRLAVVLEVLGIADQPCLDFAGGYGVLTRLMRDRGYDFYWSDRYCDNLMARGFEYDSSVGKCGAVTAFEVLEHVEDPRGFVVEALDFGSSDTLIFTTELYEGAPPPVGWWYYSLETGQHIAFYRRDTLARLASNLGMHFFTSGGLHIMSRRILPEKRLRFALRGGARLIAAAARRVRPSLTWADHERLNRKLQSER